METVVLVVILLAAVVVLALASRLVFAAFRQSRAGFAPSERQRTQVLVLGCAGLVLVLLALVTPALF